MSAAKATIAAYVEAFNTNDSDRLRALHAPDAVVYGVLGWGPIDDVIPLWRELHAGMAVHLEIREIVEEGDQIAVLFKETGTARAPFRGQPATGKSYELVAMEFYVMKDGLIFRRWGARDGASQARQVGWAS